MRPRYPVNDKLPLQFTFWRRFWKGPYQSKFVIVMKARREEVRPAHDGRGPGGIGQRVDVVTKRAVVRDLDGKILTFATRREAHEQRRYVIDNPTLPFHEGWTGHSYRVMPFGSVMASAVIK